MNLNLEDLTAGRHVCEECLAINGVREYRTTPCTEDHAARRNHQDEVAARRAVLAPNADRKHEEAERIATLLPHFDLDTPAGQAEAAETLAYAIGTTQAEYPQYDDYCERRCYGLGVATRNTRTKLGLAFAAGDVVLVTGESSAWSWRNGISTHHEAGAVRLVVPVTFTGPNHDLHTHVGEGVND